MLFTRSSERSPGQLVIPTPARRTHGGGQRRCDLSALDRARVRPDAQMGESEQGHLLVPLARFRQIALSVLVLARTLSLPLLVETRNEVILLAWSVLTALRRDRIPPRAAEQLVARGASPDAFRAETKRVTDLMKEENVALDKVCLLDPRATGEIAPQDGKEFDWFL